VSRAAGCGHAARGAGLRDPQARSSTQKLNGDTQIMKKMLVGAALALSLATAGCLGPNNAFNNLNRWNHKVTDSKWGNEGIFLVLTIIPVYTLFYWGDIIIFNSIEFWGGENPIEPNG
jgi:hypothetical protein